MVQVLFLILVFLMAILLHYLLSVSEYFSNQGDPRCVILPQELVGPNDPRLKANPFLKATYDACQLERTKIGGLSQSQLLTINTELLRLWTLAEALKPAAGAATPVAPTSGVTPLSGPGAALGGAAPLPGAGTTGTTAGTTGGTSGGTSSGTTAGTTAGTTTGTTTGTTAATAGTAGTTAGTDASGTTSTNFRTLINSLGLYTPSQNNSAITNSQNTPVAANSNLDDIRNLVEDEVTSQLRDIKLGPKDMQNNALATRNTAAVSAAAYQANSDGLVQGQDYRTDPSCPYANGQMQPKAEPYPIDMNDYVRKDSIPCWGCTLK